MIDCLPLPACLSTCGTPCCTQLSTFPQLQFIQWIQSKLNSCLPPEQPPPDWLPPSTSPIPLNYGLQVLLWTRSIIPTKCISKLAWLWPPSSCNNSLQVRLEIHIIMASKCILNLTRSRPPSASPNSLVDTFQAYLQPHWIMASKLTRSRPQSAFLSSLNHSVVKWWSSLAHSPSSILSRTLHGI